jgi:hypothetical protein
MRYNIKYSAIIGCTSWCGLGYYRGINSYKYNLNKYDIKKKYFYSDSIIYGFSGVLLYVNPVFLPFIIYKELYRVEVNVRNLQDEKNSEYYNNIIR